MNKYTKVSNYGPGGRKCPCCGPAPSLRKAFDRQVKRRERQEAKRDMMEQV